MKVIDRLGAVRTFEAAAMREARVFDSSGWSAVMVFRARFAQGGCRR